MRRSCVRSKAAAKRETSAAEPPTRETALHTPMPLDDAALHVPNDGLVVFQNGSIWAPSKVAIARGFGAVF